MRDKARLGFLKDALGDCIADEALQILDRDLGALRQVLVRDGRVEGHGFVDIEAVEGVPAQQIGGGVGMDEFARRAEQIS